MIKNIHSVKITKTIIPNSYHSDNYPDAIIYEIDAEHERDPEKFARGWGSSLTLKVELTFNPDADCDGEGGMKDASTWSLELTMCQEATKLMAHNPEFLMELSKETIINGQEDEIESYLEEMFGVRVVEEKKEKKPKMISAY